MKKKELITDLTSGPVTSTLLKFAFPIMISNLLQTAYSMVDMVIVGQFVGSAGLSSVSVGGDIMHFFVFISMGFATAGQIMTSQFVGAGKKSELGKIIGTFFTFLFLMGVVLTAVGTVFADTLLLMLSTPEAAYDGAKSYLICCMLGLVLTFGYNSVSAILRGMGESRLPMVFIGIAAVINTILDLLFVAVFGLGAFGAALATVVAQGMSFLMCIVYLYENKKQLGFDFSLNDLRIKWNYLKILLKLGIPIALQTSAGSISGLFVSSFVNSYGVVVSAITGVGNKLNNLALIVANSLNVSSSAIIGQSFGAGKIDRVKATFRRVFFFDLIFVSILAVTILIFPEEVFSIFNSDKDVLSMAHIYAPVAAISFMGFAVRSPSLGFVNGIGNSKMNFIMGFVEGIVFRIGLTYLLGVVLGFGIEGFWYGTTISSYGYALVIFPYYFSGKWKMRRSMVEDT